MRAHAARALAVIVAAALPVAAIAGQAVPGIPSGSPLSPAPAPVSGPPPPPAREPGAPLLPLHSGDPMAIRPADDPLLRLAAATAPDELFRRIVAETIARAPASAEAEANRDEAEAGLDEARAGRRPTVDLTISSYRVISRNFGNNPENLIEQARPNRRTDQILAIDQLLLDGGGTDARIGAAAARLRSADLDVESQADRTALEVIASWYDVFTFHALVAIGEAFVGSQGELRAMVEERIRRGVSARADLARVESYTASAESRLARYRRLAAQADARFTALTGQAPPPGLARAPVVTSTISRDLAALRAGETAGVRSARSAAEAARRDARAARSDTLPTLSAGIDAGRYGIYETPRDYDVRARLTIRQRLFGGIEERARQAEARARSVGARADRIGIEAGRDAEIAWSDVVALEEQARAMETTYLASRRSRDAIAERFRVASGTLFDVIAAEDNYFQTAANYLQAVTELDAARYVLLSRTGQLLPTLGLSGAVVPPPRRPAQPAPPFTGPNP